MENLDPRQVQTNRVTVIKLGTIDDDDHIKTSGPNFIEIAPGVQPHNYVKYNTFVTFNAWLVALF
jgi:glycerol-3-phosphate responsive antiterminator